jgi:H+/Cl- antiporter ClcA
MPGIESKARELKAKFYRGAPKANQPKIEEVIDIYRNNRNVSFRTVQNVVLGLLLALAGGADKGGAGLSGLHPGLRQR